MKCEHNYWEIATSISTVLALIVSATMARQATQERHEDDRRRNMREIEDEFKDKKTVNTLMLELLIYDLVRVKEYRVKDLRKMHGLIFGPLRHDIAVEEEVFKRAEEFEKMRDYQETWRFKVGNWWKQRMGK